MFSNQTSVKMYKRNNALKHKPTGPSLLMLQQIIICFKEVCIMTSGELSHESFGEYLLTMGRLLNLRIKVPIKKPGSIEQRREASRDVCRQVSQEINRYRLYTEESLMD